MLREQVLGPSSKIRKLGRRSMNDARRTAAMDGSFQNTGPVQSLEVDLTKSMLDVWKILVPVHDRPGLGI